MKFGLRNWNVRCDMALIRNNTFWAISDYVLRAKIKKPTSSWLTSINLSNLNLPGITLVLQMAVFLLLALQFFLNVVVVLPLIRRIDLQSPESLLQALSENNLDFPLKPK